jgi:hypothetical protein
MPSRQFLRVALARPVRTCAAKVDENNVQKAKVYTALALEHDPSLMHAAFNTKALLDHEVLLLQARACVRCAMTSWH